MVGVDADFVFKPEVISFEPFHDFFRISTELLFPSTIIFCIRPLATVPPWVMAVEVPNHNALSGWLKRVHEFCNSLVLSS